MGTSSKDSIFPKRAVTDVFGFGERRPLWQVVLVRAVLPATVAVAVSAALVFMLALPRLHDHLMASRRQSARILVQAVGELLAQYRQRVELGELTLEEARRRAASRIEAMRYGPNNRGYFWINTFDMRMVMHPIRQDLMDQDLGGFTDRRSGRRIFREFVEAARRPGGGFVEYDWPLPEDFQAVEPKVSYVLAFEPWQWVVGTGTYIEEVEAQMADIAGTLTVSLLAVLGLMVLLSGYMIVRNERAERDLRRSESIFRMHFRRGLIGMAIADREGTWLEVNDRLAEIVGEDPEALRGRSWIEMTRSDLRDVAASRFRTLCDGDVDEYSMESTLVRPDGDEVDVELYVTAMRRPGQSMRLAGVHVLDVTRRKQAERQQQEHIEFLNSLDRIDRVLHQATDVDDALHACLDEVRDITGADRAWLVYPCDPDAPSWRTAYQSASPQYYSHRAMGREFAMDDASAAQLAEALASEGPIVMGAGADRELPAESARDNTRSQMHMAIRPRTGKPWLVGIQQVGYDRTFSPREQRLFREIGRRLGDSLTVMLLLKEARHSEENLAITLESIGDAVIATDAEGNITRLNAVAERLTGFLAVEARGRPLSEVFQIVDANSGKPLHSPYERVLRQQGPITISRDVVLVDRMGRHRRIADSGAPIRDRTGAIVGVVLVFRDVTEELQLQTQLQHSGKMQAVGQLAGGVAHDFNNLLTAIIGNAEMLARRGADDQAIRARAEDILAASRRATQLTRQLLSFSRKDHTARADVDMHAVVRDVVGLLEHSVDRRIDLDVDLRAEDTAVRGDSGQLHNALLNLGVNARDAMPGGGTLSISTRNVVIDESIGQACSDEVEPGRYLEVAVSDTGVGMDPELQERIFEPFFTTKQPGEGTGLGLAGVYTCIKNHDGRVRVYSEPGKGSTFKLLLPTAEPAGATTEAAAETSAEEPARGEGRVLVVDDEEMVRTLTVGALKGLGYTVIEAADGRQAVETFRQEHGRLDLVLLDLIMPKLSGEDAWGLMRSIDPNVPVVICSGFSQNKLVGRLLDEGVADFLNKPYRIDELAAAVAKNKRQEK